jgi:membrane protease subunit HflC
MKNFTGLGIALLLFIISSSTYVVDQREVAIKFRFKQIVESDIKPGLHFKLPLIHTIKKFNSQILTLDAKPDRFLTNEKKYVRVDFFVKWRISDVSEFYRATRGDISRAKERLEGIMKDGLRNEFSKRTIQEAISGERGEIISSLRDKSNVDAKELGIEIIDARVSQIDFPDTVSESVYERMRSERKRVAQDFRSRGKEEAEKIRAAADRESTIIEANAYSKGETLRGEGDAKSAAIYAKAYSKDAEFYSFYRSLSAYKKALGNNGDIMVIEPDSEFFRYFKQKRIKGSTQPSNQSSNQHQPAPQSVGQTQGRKQTQAKQYAPYPAAAYSYPQYFYPATANMQQYPPQKPQSKKEKSPEAEPVQK